MYYVWDEELGAYRGVKEESAVLLATRGEKRQIYKALPDGYFYKRDNLTLWLTPSEVLWLWNNGDWLLTAEGEAERKALEEEEEV